ncbi:MAG TPA: bifunctional ADP-heptose synthase [Nitrolancea sp.]|nr:bifunctional ADP-heptose synthase [Nitrolancea sp.]
MDDLLPLLPLLDRIRGRRVLVIGDLYLDAYIFGQPERVSREAPIIILQETRRENRPGGGTAPALALRALGADVWLTGVVGDDDAGHTLIELMQAQGVDTGGIVIDRGRPTTTKTRMVAEGQYNTFPQQVARSDRQDRSPVASPIAQNLMSYVREIGPEVDAVLLSDYRSGVLVPELIATARESNALSTVDSQGELASFDGLALVKCNQAEAEKYLGRTLRSRAEREEPLLELRRMLHSTQLVVTLGPDGAALAIDGDYDEIPSFSRRQVFDVTGAGDTVIAVMTGALAAGATPRQALELSQVAAGIVIGKWGNAQASADEIAAVIRES